MATVVTPVGEIPKIVADCRATYHKRTLFPISKRRELLKTLIKMLDDNVSTFRDTVHKDLRKPSFELDLTEIGLPKNDAFLALSELESWAKPKAVDLDLAFKMEDCTIKSEPLGVVLIIGAWNYPVQLLFAGMVGAIAAGNSVILKPSEVAGHTADAVARIVPKYFDPSVCAVVCGGVPETTALLNERFDHIMYTGNSRVARIVMAAAAKNLTPVTLELGGKSPCIIDEKCDLRIAARRVAWGRTTNCGQTCIAPDYLLLQKNIKDAFVGHLKQALSEFLGANPKECKDYARIVNDMHFNRIRKLMDGGKIIHGGEVDAASRYIAPTIIDDVNLDHPLMTDEIFGPLFPIVTYTEIDEAIEFINKRPKPLALYMFSTNKERIEKVEINTSSGALTVNDTLMHAGVHTLPFGGVGESGMGAYHGKKSFDTFSHQKAVMKRKLALEGLNDMRYMPYADWKMNRLKLFGLIRTGPGRPWIKYVVFGSVLAVAALSVYFGAFFKK